MVAAEFQGEFPQQVVRQGFLWCLAAVYLFAFTSLYVQIPGLYGDNGLLPASYILHDLSTCIDKHSSCAMWASASECQNNSKWMMSHCMKTCNNCQALDTSLSGLLNKTPTLLWLTPSLGLNTSTGMELLCVIGIVLSMVLLISQRCRDCLSYLVLWFLYYSMVQVGQIFLWYQWDGLLLETGFLAIIVAPWNISLTSWRWICCCCKRYRNMARHHDSVTLWLVKWLLFRLMFASGVVKLYFMDPTWWELTAMYWHYESQCIPTPLAWFFQKLPKWFHRLSAVITYVIEIGLPFLFFVPVRAIRIFAYGGQVFLQLLILLTGNYNFFNLLTMVLCISLLDDTFITSRMTCSPCTQRCRNNKGRSEDVEGVKRNSDTEAAPGPSNPKKDESPQDIAAKLSHKGETALLLHLADKLIEWINDKERTKSLTVVREFMCSKAASRLKTAVIVISFLATIAVMCVLVRKWFWFEVTDGGLYSWIAFSPDDFRRAVAIATPAAMWIGFASLMSEIVVAILRSLLDGKTWLKKAWSLFQCVTFSLVALWMFAVSLSPLTDISATAKYNLPSVFRGWYKEMKYLQIAHPYGLFRSMTGIGGRPEIIILGSNSTIGPWREYNFLYKPGNIYAPPPFVAPQQPRLDWQMWFAALESYDANPWFLSLLHKLLLGHKDVLHLMGENPFPSTPPRYIRAQIFTYHYTQNTSRLGDVLFHSSSNSAPWWSREYAKDYIPFVISNESLSDLERILQRFRVYRPKFPPEATYGFIHSMILQLRQAHRKTAPTTLISTLLFATVMLLVFKVWWRKMGRTFCTPTFVKVKDKCEQVNERISRRTEYMVQICRAYGSRSPRFLRCQCFVMFVGRFCTLYRGMCLMLEEYWVRGGAAGKDGWLRVKTRLAAIKSPLKKIA